MSAQYLVERLPDGPVEGSQERINAIAAEGYRLVSVTTDAHGTGKTAYFERISQPANTGKRSTVPERTTT